MKAGTGQACGIQATPALVEQAIHQALANADLERAGSILLFLTQDFQHHPQAALLAAARAAGTMEIAGCTASGLLTERGWLLDQPAAVALVMEECDTAQSQALGFCNHMPLDWHHDPTRYGLLDSDGCVWSHARLISDGCAEARLPPCRLLHAHSLGLRLLGSRRHIDAALAYELQQVDGQSALDNLRRALPAALRGQPPLHQIVALRDPSLPYIPIIAAGSGGALIMGEMLDPGEEIVWAIRQPLAVEQDMRNALAPAVDQIAQGHFQPDCAIMFSCIGRGPLFYGDEDRDLAIFRESFPGLPLIGAYGNGQIAPAGSANHLYHNSVSTLFLESTHV
jgi:hypothetical protein